jgi:hypothetical protein
VRDGLGQVAHAVIALLEKPFVDLRIVHGALLEQARGDRLARLAAGQEVDRPGRVGGVGAAK